MRYAVDGQLLWIQAFNAAGYVEDDQANITCDLVNDGAAAIALGNPTQSTSKRGAYYYVLTAAQATAYAIKPLPRSSTAGVQVQGTPPMIYPTQGAVSVSVLPLTGQVPERAEGAIIPLYVGELVTSSVNAVDENEQAVDLTGRTLRLAVETKSKVSVANIVPSISGSTFTFAATVALTASARTLDWALWDETDPTAKAILMKGTMPVTYAPQ